MAKFERGDRLIEKAERDIDIFLAGGRLDGKLVPDCEPIKTTYHTSIARFADRANRFNFAFPPKPSNKIAREERQSALDTASRVDENYIGNERTAYAVDYDYLEDK